MAQYGTDHMEHASITQPYNIFNTYFSYFLSDKTNNLMMMSNKNELLA